MSKTVVKKVYRDKDGVPINIGEWVEVNEDGTKNPLPERATSKMEVVVQEEDGSWRIKVEPI